jgi:hypothetical protein
MHDHVIPNGTYRRVTKTKGAPAMFGAHRFGPVWRICLIGSRRAGIDPAGSDKFIELACRRASRIGYHTTGRIQQ